MQEELDELFADLWQVPGFVGRRHGFRPHVDCFVSDNPRTVTIVVELAGIDPNEVDISVSERTVTISGTRRRPKHDCHVSYQQMEIEYGSFQRQVRLAEDVDPAEASASFENGVLTIVLPVADHAPPAGRFTIEVWQT